MSFHTIIEKMLIAGRLTFFLMIAAFAGAKKESPQEVYLGGVPNLSERTDAEDSGFVFTADFLAWFASEDVASIWTGAITFGDEVSTWLLPSFEFQWDYGFRVGAGYDLAYDKWDTVFYWSWFRTDATHRIPYHAGTIFQPEFDAAFLAGASPKSMSASWSLLFNMFNWELGRSYRLSKGLSIRPFVGVQGGWIHQSIHAKYDDLIIDLIFPTDHTGTEHLRNNFWGVGPMGGINTKWRVYDFGNQFLDLFGDFSTSTMWGTWACHDFYENTLSETYSVNTPDSSQGSLMFRGFSGLGWDVNFRGGKSHFAAKLGFEMQLWLDQLRIATFQVQRLHNDLTLQGVTLHAQLDF